MKNNEVDLILLDLMLPKLSGMDFLKQIRATSLIPVLIISAKGSDIDKALGLGFGADDYISKPFSMIELTAQSTCRHSKSNSISSFRESTFFNIRFIIKSFPLT